MYLKLFNYAWYPVVDQPTLSNSGTRITAETQDKNF